MDICISTVYGYQDNLKEKDTLIFFWKNIQKVAGNRNVEFQVNHIIKKEQAQNAHIPFTTFSLFYNDEVVTHEILSENKFDKILTSKGL